MKKTYKKTTLISCLLALCVLATFWVMPTKAVASDTAEFDCTYSVPEKKPYFQYGASEVIEYTEQEAKDAGIPEGFSGTVISIKPTSPTASGSGVLLDFTAKGIKTDLVEHIAIRFYLGESDKNTGDKPQLRIMSPVTGHWVYQPTGIPSVTGEWATEIVENTDSLFDALADENGNLGKFELSVRVNEHVDFFIDSITLKLVENDGVAPEITCEDGDSVSVALGSILSLNATAYDAQDKCNVPIEYVWGDGVELDDNGIPNACGEYVLTLRAVDSFGNVATKNINVTIIEPDLEKPVIHLSFTEMYAQVGMKPILNFQITDNQKVVDSTRAWSEGALDKNGALTEGTHTYTVTATDDSGNVAVHTVTVYVTVGEPEYDNVIDEEALTPRYTVTFDGQNGAIYKYGEKVKEPSEPVKDADDEYSYVFEGWFNDGVAWNFSEDVVTEDLNLVSKWTEIPNSQGGEDSEPDSEPDDSSVSSSESDEPTQSSDSEESSSNPNESSRPSQSSENESLSSSSSDSSSSTSTGGCLGMLDIGIFFCLLLPVSLCLVVRRKKKA